MPHILAFGRGVWVKFAFFIIVMAIWNMVKKKNLKTVFRQVALVCILGTLVIYSFIQFIPRSDYYMEALGARVTQGEEDYKYGEGTLGTRLASTQRLVVLWMNSNVLIGIGMHPMWVIKAVTVEESFYTWGFSDVRWASILAAYGAIGFILAIIFQIYYFVVVVKILKHNRNTDILLFLVIILFSTLILDSTIDYSNGLFTFALAGFNSISLEIAAVVYKFEEMNKNLS